ncbi:MAG: GtrA family protein [Cellulomonadaceae bacterium]|nr:GtrA family protein [Cellulomonadaceae bacterium]
MSEAVHVGEVDDTAPVRLIDALRTSVLARFASVGIVNTIVDLGLYMILFAVGVTPLVANLISTSAGMAVSFAGNRRLVFGSTGHAGREATLFVLVCGAGIWGVQPLVIHAVTGALMSAGLVAPLILSGLSKVAAILVAAVWNFVLYKEVVFRNGARRRGEEVR